MRRGPLLVLAVLGMGAALSLGLLLSEEEAAPELAVGSPEAQPHAPGPQLELPLRAEERDLGPPPPPPAARAQEALVPVTLRSAEDERVSGEAVLSLFPGGGPQRGVEQELELELDPDGRGWLTLPPELHHPLLVWVSDLRPGATREPVASVSGPGRLHPRPGVNEPLELLLLPGGELDVVVRDAFGAPVAEARVRVNTREGTVERHAETDASGSVRLRALPCGELQVTAEGPTEVAAGSLRLNGRDRIVLTLEAPVAFGSLELSFRDEDGAQLNLDAILGLSPLFQGPGPRDVTVEGSDVRVEGLAPGRWLLFGDVSDPPGLSFDKRTVAVPAGDVVRSEVRLHPLGTLRGRVHHGGVPVEALIQISSEGEGQPVLSSTFADHFEWFGLGGVRVRASQEGRGVAFAELSLVPGETEELLLDLRRAAVLRVLVRDGAGRPHRAGTAIHLWPVAAPQRLRSTFLGLGGRAELEVAEPGRYRIACRHEMKELTIAGDTLVELCVERAPDPSLGIPGATPRGALLVRVEDPRGQALPEAFVFARAEPGGEEHTVTTNAGGVAWLELLPREYLLSAVAMDSAEGAPQRLRVVAGETREVLLRSGERIAAGAVRGQLRGLGAASSRPRIVARPQEDTGRGTEAETVSAVPDAGGRFRLAPLRAYLPYRVTVEEGWAAEPQLISVTPNEERALQLAVRPIRPGRVEVQGDGIIAVEVLAAAFAGLEEGWPAEAEVWVAEVQPGRHRVRVRFAGDGHSVWRYERGIEIAPGQTLRLSAEPATGSARLRLFLAWSGPFHSDMPPPHPTRILGPGFSFEGYWANMPLELERLPPGAYRLEHGGRVVVEWTLEPGQAHDLGAVDLRADPEEQ